MNKIRVLVADDHLIMRKGIIKTLATAPNIEIVGDVSNGRKAVEKAAEVMPDVVVMDIMMPEMDGVTATRIIVDESPHIKVLVLTVSDESKNLMNAIKAGASGYLLKDMDKKTLVEAITAVYRGESIISQAMAADLLDEFKKLLNQHEPQPEMPQPKLTTRESEILELIADGLDNKAIAKRLFVSQSTVKNHISNILSKLHLQNRIQAAVYATQKGISKQR